MPFRGNDPIFIILCLLRMYYMLFLLSISFVLLIITQTQTKPTEMKHTTNLTVILWGEGGGGGCTYTSLFSHKTAESIHNHMQCIPRARHLPVHCEQLSDDSEEVYDKPPRLKQHLLTAAPNSESRYAYCARRPTQLSSES